MLKWEDYNIPFDQCLKALLHDSIDAFFYVGAAPSNLLKSLSSGLRDIIKLVDIDNKQLKDFYKAKFINKKIYPWMSKDVTTFSVKSLLAINTKNLSQQQSKEIDLLYNDLKGNLKGIQKNKLSHRKWISVDFSDMDGIDWPVYKEKYISIDFFSLLLAYIAALLSLIQIYFIINKLWKRKHEKLVAESISISAMFISIIINGSFAFKNFHDGGMPQFSANLMWILASSVSALIGMGLFVAMNKNLGFFALLKQALKLESKEAGDLAKLFFRPNGADKIIEILGRMAMVDENLDKREKDFIQSFADHWDIKIDWDDVKKYSLESGDRYEKIKLAMTNYLYTKPQEEQVNQLRDVFNLLVNIDEVVTEEEKLILDELEGQIAEYLNKNDDLEIYKVAIVPQTNEQDESMAKLLSKLSREKIAGGYAYLSVPYYSERYAEIISSQYRSMKIFSVVIKPKHLNDMELITKIFEEGLKNRE